MAAPSMVLGRQMLSSMSEFLVLAWWNGLGKSLGTGFDVVAETRKPPLKNLLVSVNWFSRMAVKDWVEFAQGLLSLWANPAAGDSVARPRRNGTRDSWYAWNDGPPWLSGMTNVKKGGVSGLQNQAGGLSAAFIPCFRGWKEWLLQCKMALSLGKLEAMTAIRPVGLDMIAIPEDTLNETIAILTAESPQIEAINMKPIAVRIIPKEKEGDTIESLGPTR